MSNDREIGQLTEAVGNLKSDVAEIKEDVKKMTEFMQQAKGSWKTVMGIAGFAAAVGALAAKLLPWVPFK
jgi:hypothetical protein